MSDFLRAEGGKAASAAYLLAFLIVAMWGATFVQTKVLINEGLHPEEIFFYRFLLAYILMLPVSRDKLFLDSWRDELSALVLGLTGGSLYFLTENYALAYGYCYNVSLIVCLTPLVTAVVVGWFYPSERLSHKSVWGALLSFVGMALVVFNGNFVLELSPLGDVLAFVACLCWAVYSLIIKKLQYKYSTLLITRKVFGYGLLTILPLLFFNTPQWEILFSGNMVVWGNLLALGCVASMLCYLGWNRCLKQIGTVRATNFLYLNPVITMLTSALVIGERITWIAIAGAAMILAGMIYADKNRLRKI